MAPTNETGLVKAIVTALTKTYPDIWAVKIHGGPMQEVGIPDLLVCLDGTLIGLEVKHRKPGESEEHARARATRWQLRQLEKIRAAGGYGAVVISVEEALDLCEEVLHA